MKINFLSIAAWLIGYVHVVISGQAALPDTLDLVRQSDFVGLILADPLVSDPSGEWRQTIDVSHIDSLKNTLRRDPAMSDQYPWISADHARASGYPTRFSQKGEYLAFLKKSVLDGHEAWTTIAAFRIEYRPDATGRIVGTIGNSRQNRQGMSVSRVRAILEGLAANPNSVPDMRPLDLLLQSTAASSGEPDAPRKQDSHEDRLREAQQLAAAIRIGTNRADIEKVFPQEDGGISGPGSTRYYLGSEVMVEVPYDQTGGAWKPQNLVNGPLKVYRSLMHPD